MVCSPLAFAYLNEFPDHYTRLQKMESEAKISTKVINETKDGGDSILRTSCDWMSIMTVQH